MNNNVQNFPKPQIMEKFHCCGSENILASVPRPSEKVSKISTFLMPLIPGITTLVLMMPAREGPKIACLGATGASIGVSLGGACFATTCISCVYTSHYIKEIKDFQNHRTLLSERTIYWILRNDLHQHLYDFIGEEDFRSLMDSQGEQFLNATSEEIAWRGEWLDNCTPTRDPDYDGSTIRRFFLEHGAHREQLTPHETTIDEYGCRLDDNELKLINYGSLSKEYKLKLIKQIDTYHLPSYFTDQKIENLEKEEIDEIKTSYLSDSTIKKFLEIPTLNDDSKVRFLQHIQLKGIKPFYSKNINIYQPLLAAWLKKPGKTPMENIRFLIDQKIPFEENDLIDLHLKVSFKNFKVLFDKRESKRNANVLDQLIAKFPETNFKRRETLCYMLEKTTVTKKQAERVLPHFVNHYMPELTKILKWKTAADRLEIADCMLRASANHNPARLLLEILKIDLKPDEPKKLSSMMDALGDHVKQLTTIFNKLIILKESTR